MMRRYIGMTVAMIAVLVSPVFGQQQQPDMDQLMKAMGAAFGAMQQTSTNAVALVDFRKLKEQLPAELTGLRRTSISGEKSGAMGMTISKAEAAYRGDAGSVDIEISDMGGLGGLGMMAQAGWQMAEIDRETDSGFERTALYKGFKTHQEYDTQDKDGTIEVMIGGRIMLKIEGSGLAFADLLKVLDKFDLKKIEALAKSPSSP